MPPLPGRSPTPTDSAGNGGATLKIMGVLMFRLPAGELVVGGVAGLSHGEQLSMLGAPRRILLTVVC
jgi:hypothetical protein